MFVVTGITGNTGSAVARTLLERGERVTALVRDPGKAANWAAKGVKLITGSLFDAGSLTEAFSGADGAYLVLPPDFAAVDYLGERARMADAMATAIRDSGMRRAVLLSSIGAQHSTGVGAIRSLHYAEQAIADALPTATMLRASYFFENWGSVIPTAREKGELPNFLTPDRKLPMISTQDIGRIAAETLVSRGGHKVLEITGPADYTPAEIAAELGGLLGRHVALQNMPLSAVGAAMASMGASSSVAGLMEEMLHGINSGIVSYESVDAPHIRGDIDATEALRGILGASALRAS